MVRIILCGCNGRMGQVISDLAREEAEVSIVAGIDLNTETKNGYPVYPSLEECEMPADVVIDFSSPKAFDSLLPAAVKKGLPVVLCTTGLSKEQLLMAEEASKQIALLRSANMSVGVNTLLKLVKIAAQALVTADFDVELVEKHHNQKLDAPSGTALALADAINEALNNEYYYKFDRSTERVKRDKREIGISSVRGGTIVGEHEIIFAGTDEVVEIKHTAYSKAIFGKGALQAAKYLAGKPAGRYTMSDVIA